MKDKINKIGILNYTLWELLCIIERVLNIPYYILKIVVEVFHLIFDLLDNVFEKENFIYLIRFKPIRRYFEYLKRKMK